MKKFFLSIFLFCISIQAFASSEATKLYSLLDPIWSLQARFEQTIKSEQGRVLQRLSGKVMLKKPGQFRWEVLGKEPRLIVADGKKVWDFDKDLEQVTVQKLNKEQIQAPIFFLTGDTASLETDFKINSLPLKQGMCLEGSNACFELKPKRQEGSFQWIRIGFKDGILNKMELLDQLGQYSTFLFKEVKLNQPIPSAQFTFVPPPHVDVLVND